MDNETLRQIPKIDELLAVPSIEKLCDRHNILIVKTVLREVLDELRQKLLSGEVTSVPEEKLLLKMLESGIKKAQTPSLRPLINASGVTLHTNLGRALLSKPAVQAVTAVSSAYSNLEYNLQEGKRGERYSHVESLLQKITGAESAFVVNNNAAAVLLVLSDMAAGGEVICSRGELVEIGGSFRVPDIMQSCGCTLREVGATNKTHLRDYKKAINKNTLALLKVHTSNYKICGFTESVGLKELSDLAHAKGLPVIEDLGSGSLVDLEQFGIHGEPTVQQSVIAGVDVITFSGDKLLGGPQSGIIIGKKKYIDSIKRHPLARAVRVDKMTLSALEATLQSYAMGTAIEDIPSLISLSLSVESSHKKAEVLLEMLTNAKIPAEIISENDQVGGGSVPTQLLPTYALAINPKSGSVDDLEQYLRGFETPIIGRISKNRYLLHIRCIDEKDYPTIVTALKGYGV